MTKKEYESRLAELQTQIDELKNTKIEEKPPHPRWRPFGKLIQRIITTDDERYRRLEQRIDDLEQKRLDDLENTVKMWKALTMDRENGGHHDAYQSH